MASLPSFCKNMNKKFKDESVTYTKKIYKQSIQYLRLSNHLTNKIG